MKPNFVVVDTVLCVITPEKHLFSDEHWKVAVFLVDFSAKSDEAQQIDTETHAPHDQLPVAKLIQKCSIVL